MSRQTSFTPGTIQAMLAESRHLSADPAVIAGHAGEIVYSHYGSGVEMRFMVEGASSLGLGATVTVYLPEIDWRLNDGSFRVRPAYISHSSSNSNHDPGDTEASVALLQYALELRDALNAEADVALAPEMERLNRQQAESAAKRAVERERTARIADRLRSQDGATVRVTRASGRRVTGTLAVTASGNRIVVTEKSGKKITPMFHDVALLEVKDGARFQPFALEA